MAKKEFNQLCVLEGTVVGNSKKVQEDFILPDNPECTETGGRNDLFFYIADKDISKFAVPRLRMGIRWWEDVLGNGNGKLYPREILEKYPKTW